MTTSGFNPASFVGANGEYGDWTNYAGFKPTDTIEPVIPRKTPGSTTETPTDLSGYVKQAVAPITNKITNYGNAGANLMAGNFGGAVKSFHAGQDGTSVPVASAPEPKANPYGYAQTIDE